MNSNAFKSETCNFTDREPVPNKHPTFQVSVKKRIKNTFDLDATCTRYVQVYGVVSV